MLNSHFWCWCHFVYLFFFGIIVCQGFSYQSSLLAPFATKQRKDRKTFRGWRKARFTGVHRSKGLICFKELHKICHFRWKIAISLAFLTIFDTLFQTFNCHCMLWGSYVKNHNMLRRFVLNWELFEWGIHGLSKYLKSRRVRSAMPPLPQENTIINILFRYYLINLYHRRLSG